MSRLAIAAYHKVGDPAPGGWETWFYVPEPIFRAQLARFGELGWTVIDRTTFLRGLAEPNALPERALLLTFDDGDRTLTEIVQPVLAELGLPAVAFVPVDHIGGTNDWSDGAEPPERICSWTELLDLERDGIAIESHGCSHRTLSTLEPAARRRELRRSKHVLEERLGRPVQLYAFPYGDEGGEPGALGAELADAGYSAAFLYGGGPVQAPVGDPFRIERLALGPDSDIDELVREG